MCCASCQSDPMSVGTGAGTDLAGTGLEGLSGVATGAGGQGQFAGPGSPTSFPVQQLAAPAVMAHPPPSTAVPSDDNFFEAFTGAHHQGLPFLQSVLPMPILLACQRGVVAARAARDQYCVAHREYFVAHAEYCVSHAEVYGRHQEDWESSSNTISTATCSRG